MTEPVASDEALVVRESDARPGNSLTRLSGWGAYGILVVTTAQADFAGRAGTRPGDLGGSHPATGRLRNHLGARRSSNSGERPP